MRQKTRGIYQRGGRAKTVSAYAGRIYNLSDYDACASWPFICACVVSNERMGNRNAVSVVCLLLDYWDCCLSGIRKTDVIC